MPDIDVFFGNAPWDPLAIHRGFTHGLVGGVLVMPPMLAGLLWLLDRWQVEPRRARSRAGCRCASAGWSLLGYLGALTHPLLDLLTTYSVQLLSPFSDRWFHADGLFIIDVWLWLLLARRDRRLEAARAAAAASGGGLPQAAIGIVLAYIGVNLLITDRADAAVRDWAGGRPARPIFASPPPVAFWRRDLVWREGDCYRRSRYDPLAGGFGRVSDCQPTNMSDPLVREAIRRDPRLRKFLKWSILPQAEVEREGCSSGSRSATRATAKARRSRLARETVVPTGGRQAR